MPGIEIDEKIIVSSTGALKLDKVPKKMVVDYFRKSSRIPIYDNKGEFDIFQIIGDDIPNIESSLISDQVRKDLHKLISELPIDQKEVLKMRLYKNMSFKEIAKSSGVSINTALGRMRYAIINIRKLIDQHQIILSA